MQAAVLSDTQNLSERSRFVTPILSFIGVMIDVTHFITIKQHFVCIERKYYRNYSLEVYEKLGFENAPLSVCSSMGVVDYVARFQVHCISDLLHCTDSINFCTNFFVLLINGSTIVEPILLRTYTLDGKGFRLVISQPTPNSILFL